MWLKVLGIYDSNNPNPIADKSIYVSASCSCFI